MKIPIEFVNASDSKFQTLLDDSAEFSNFRRLNVDLEVAKSQNDTATTLLALTSGLIRTASAYKEILKFEESFKKTTVEINTDLPPIPPKAGASIANLVWSRQSP